MKREDSILIHKAVNFRKKLESALNMFPDYTKAITQSWNCYCCKYYEYTKGNHCKKHDCKMGVNDFCSYFERATREE